MIKVSELWENVLFATYFCFFSSRAELLLLLLDDTDIGLILKSNLFPSSVNRGGLGSAQRCEKVLDVVELWYWS